MKQLKSIPQSHFREASAVNPFFENEAFAAVGNNKVRASISGLFALGSPLAVLGIIGFVIVNSFNRILRRWRITHIGVKSLEGHPSFTDRDSPSAIVGIGWIPIIQRSLFHMSPDAVYTTISHSVSARRFSPAAARLGYSQVPLSDFFDNSADATANPSRTFIRDSLIAYCPIAKDLSFHFLKGLCVIPPTSSHKKEYSIFGIKKATCLWRQFV